MYASALNFAALMLHEQTASVVTSMLSTYTPQRHHASIPLQEQRDENDPLLHIFKEDATSWVGLLLFISIAYKLVYLQSTCLPNL